MATRVLVENSTEPGVILLGVEWKKPDGLRYRSFIPLRASDTGRQTAEALRELARQIDEELNRF